MRSLFLAGALALAALPAAPEPVRADCLNEQIASCNADFGATSEKLAGIRGWCYMIRIGWCALID
jgi:hypothetical protein